MSENIIEIKKLKKSFGEVNAVSGVDFIVKKGEMFGLVGPDGAGKTTIIKMLCGILEPDSGAGKILGFDFKKDKDKIKQHIGYLSQKFSLYQDLTIDENIEFFAEIHKVKNYKEKRDELLKFTRLIEFRTRLAGRLSGGMKQKLALACTLIHKPEIIFLDEPTTGVDPVSRRDFWKILFSLLKDGITIILTTPYLDEAERCTKISLINGGKFLVSDNLMNIKKLMDGVFFEIVCSEIRNAYKILSRHKKILEVQTFGDRIDVQARSKKDLNDILLELKSNKIKIIDTREISPSLENIFISLVNKDLKREE